jgi:hypothetical protein
MFVWCGRTRCDITSKTWWREKWHPLYGCCELRFSCCEYATCGAITTMKIAFSCKPCICKLSNQRTNQIFHRIIRRIGAGIDQWYSAGLRAGWSGVRVSVGAGNSSPYHGVQTVFGAHPASYPMGNRGSFSVSKAAGAWSWPLNFIYCRGQECVDLYLHSPNTPSWNSAELKIKAQGQLYLYLFLVSPWVQKLLLYFGCK